MWGLFKYDENLKIFFVVTLQMLYLDGSYGCASDGKDNGMKQNIKMVFDFEELPIKAITLYCKILLTTLATISYLHIS
jgi:hypothetical protein